MGGDHQLLFHAHFFDALAQHAGEFDTPPDDPISLAGVKPDGTAIFGMGFEHRDIVPGAENVLLDGGEKRPTDAVALMGRGDPQIGYIVAHRLTGAPTDEIAIMLGHRDGITGGDAEQLKPLRIRD